MTSLIVPTVVHNGNPFYVRQQDQTNSSFAVLSVAAAHRKSLRRQTTWWTAFHHRPFETAAVIIPNIEAVAEIKVQVNTYDAEMGRTGGRRFQHNHEVRGHIGMARDSLQQRPQPWSAKELLRQREIRFPILAVGGAAGGRSRRTKRSSGQQRRDTRPGRRGPENERADHSHETSDFSGVCQNIFDPTTTRPDPGGPGTFMRTQFTGNRFRRAAECRGKGLMKYWPSRISRTH